MRWTTKNPLFFKSFRLTATLLSITAWQRQITSVVVCAHSHLQQLDTTRDHRISNSKNLAVFCSSLTTRQLKQWLCQDIVITASKSLKARLPSYSGTAACATLALTGLFSSANIASLRPAGLAHIMPKPPYFHPLPPTKACQPVSLFDEIPPTFTVLISSYICLSTPIYHPELQEGIGVGMHRSWWQRWHDRNSFLLFFTYYIFPIIIYFSLCHMGWWLSAFFFFPLVHACWL